MNAQQRCTSYFRVERLSAASFERSDVPVAPETASRQRSVLFLDKSLFDFVTHRPSLLKTLQPVRFVGCNIRAWPFVLVNFIEHTWVFLPFPR
jgi:hypothetical protein